MIEPVERIKIVIIILFSVLEAKGKTARVKWTHEREEKRC